MGRRKEREAKEYEEIRLWIKTHLRLIERPEDLEMYMKAFAWLEKQKHETNNKSVMSEYWIRITVEETVGGTYPRVDVPGDMPFMLADEIKKVVKEFYASTK